MGPYQLVLAATVLCEILLVFFLFCIARFYELKFREHTYHVSFLIPAFVLAGMLLVSLFGGLELEADLLITSFSTLLVLLTTGLFLYRKMMGVAR